MKESDDGNVVAFSSNATDLVTGDTNTDLEPFVRNFQLGKTKRVPLNYPDIQSSANQLPRISPNGSVVAFDTQLYGLIDGVSDTNNAPDAFFSVVSW